MRSIKQEWSRARFLGVWLALSVLMGCSDSALSNLPDNLTYEPLVTTEEPSDISDTLEPTEIMESFEPSGHGED